MKRSASYHTKQRETIISYLSSLGSAHITAGSMAEYFNEQGISIGLTTVYRQLNKLIQKGLVRKFSVDGINGACYQYLGDESNMGDHYHLKCEKCGELIHLQCDQIEALGQHIFERHSFTLKPQKTLFCGTCNMCYLKESDDAVLETTYGKSEST